jgi:hypothetical protein
MPDRDLTDPLAAALARLRPAPAAVEKPAFLFRAGQASRDAVVRRWQAVAALTTLALVASLGYGYVRFTELLHQLETTHAQLREVAAASAPIDPSTLPASTPAPVFEVPAAAPTPEPTPYYEPDPTPEELAVALRQRNEILTAGLTLLPPAAPPSGTVIRHHGGGVLAVPPHEPKKPTPIFPDDEE